MTQPLRQPNRAHPRVGGENFRSAGAVRFRAGSSPRGRGKLAPVIPTLMEIRLIPAWAGKTTLHLPPP